jgi:hypothetical protein
MPDPITHFKLAVLKTTVASAPDSIAPSVIAGGISGTIAAITGVDSSLWLCAMGGALAWRLAQPAIDPNYEAIKKAFGLAAGQMIIGVCGALYMAAHGFEQPIFAGLISLFGTAIIAAGLKKLKRVGNE